MEVLFVENSSTDRGHLKKRIIKDNLIDYLCDRCGNNGEWNGKKLVLQLEHKNDIDSFNILQISSSVYSDNLFFLFIILFICIYK